MEQRRSFGTEPSSTFTSQKLQGEGSRETEKESEGTGGSKEKGTAAWGGKQNGERGRRERQKQSWVKRGRPRSRQAAK